MLRKSLPEPGRRSDREAYRATWGQGDILEPRAAIEATRAQRLRARRIQLGRRRSGVDADPRLQAFWAKRFPFDEGWESQNPVFSPEPRGS